MPLNDQIEAFAWTLVIGMAIGLCYEIYRAVKDVLRLRKYGTFAGDIIFWLFITAFVFIMLIRANYGQLRLYVFIGLILGAFLFVRLLGGVTYSLVSRLFYLAGRMLRLAALLLYYAWRVVTFPLRIIFITVAFPVHLAGRLLGGAGKLAGRLAGRPVNAVKGRICMIAAKLLRKTAPPQ